MHSSVYDHLYSQGTDWCWKRVKQTEKKPVSSMRKTCIILSIAERQSFSDIIILGDFNAYTDFEWPVSLLLEHDMESKCSNYIKAMGVRQHFFLDAWKILYPNKPGLTFSNMVDLSFWPDI